MNDKRGQEKESKSSKNDKPTYNNSFDQEEELIRKNIVIRTSPPIKERTEIESIEMGEIKELLKI